VNNFLKVVTRKWNGRESNPGPFESQVQRPNRCTARPQWAKVGVLGVSRRSAFSVRLGLRSVRGKKVARTRLPSVEFRS